MELAHVDEVVDTIADLQQAIFDSKVLIFTIYTCVICFLIVQLLFFSKGAIYKG